MAIARRGRIAVAEVPFIFFWTIPIAAASAIVALLLRPRLMDWSVASRYLISLLTGVALGLLWTSFVRLIFGEMFGAIGLPALTCWVVGAVSGVAGGLVIADVATGLKRLMHGLLLCVFVVFAALASEPAAIKLRNEQSLTLLLVKWTRTAEPLSIEVDPFASPTDEALALLRAATQHGHLEVWGEIQHGHGPPSTAIVVLHSPLETPVILPQPDRATIVYVQQGRGFRSYPEQVDVLARRIELGEINGRLTYEVELANGGAQWGVGFSW